MNRKLSSTLVLIILSFSLSGCLGAMSAVGLASLEQNKAKGCETLEKDLRSNKKNKEVDVKWGMINGYCKDYYTAPAK